MQSTYWLENVLKMISFYVNALLCTLQYIVIHALQYTAELQRLYDNMLQSVQKCVDIKGDNSQHIL